jgi:hypothetical protein
MKENTRIKKWLNKLSKTQPHRRAFRINAGQGWVSNKYKWIKNVLMLHSPRPLQAGPEGWHDCVGWTSVEVTPEMVGKKVAVFTFSEFKKPGEKYRDEQRRLADLVTRMGGICEVITE